MATVNVTSATGKVAGTVELPDAVFDVQVNVPLVHQVVVAQLAAARQGTHDTKTRGEVRGGGRKPYRQKGTGRARQGSLRAPQFAGGGTVHGPTPRSYAQRTPKKMKAAALRSALSDRARAGRVHVVSSFVDGEQPSTKAAVGVLDGVTTARRVLVVIDRTDVVGWKSLRNVDRAHVIAPDQLNPYDVLVADDVVFTESSLGTFLGGDVPVAPVVDATPNADAATPAEDAATPAEDATSEPVAAAEEPVAADAAEPSDEEGAE
jgi:large subunit ribosomal protein L4